MTSQDYIKVEHVRTLLLRSSLSKFRQFHSECCSSTLLQFDFFRLRGPYPVVTFVVLWFYCFVLLAKVGNFFYFLVWKFQTVFRWKPCFRKAVFCAFCWFLSALKLHLHVVALSASMIMSWPAMLASKLNMSGLDFVAPVLQSSNSFHLKAFFQVLFSLIGSVCKRNDNLLPSESVRSIVFCARSRVFFLFFFPSEASNDFPVKSMFSEGLILHF